MKKPVKQIIKIVIFPLDLILSGVHGIWMKMQFKYLNLRASTRFKSCGEGLSIKLPFHLRYEQFMQIGDNFKASPGMRMDCIGKYNGIKYQPQLIIGNNVSFNYNCHIGCFNKIVIGNDVMVGSHVLIEDHSHGTTDDICTPVAKRDICSKGPIIIEDNVWIGENVCILENVTIGRCSVIGANAVVTHDIPPYSVAVGAPARVIKKIK